MSRGLLIASIALASYGLLSVLGSLLAMLAWHSGRLTTGRRAPAILARRLVVLRAFPAAFAGVITAALVMPAFVLFEPMRASEPVGPLLVGLALLGLGLLAAGCALGLNSVLATWRIERRWLHAARPLDLDPPAGVPAYAVESFTPIVALVGVFAPKLLAARTVIDACDQDELARIVAHERGHLRARDNLKRWLMACAPDLLRWTPAHHAIVLAWDDAAEDAADDEATAGHEVARLDLAALLVKVARLSAGPGWTAATISPFIARNRLDRRVRRLLSSTQAPESPRSAPGQVLVGTAVVSVMLTIVSPWAMETVYEAVEAIVAFGR